MSDLGSAIAAGRRSAGLSQQAIARRMDVAQSTVSTWESGAVVPTVAQPVTTDEMIRTIIAAPMIDCPNPTEPGMTDCIECARTAHPGKHYTSGGIRTNAQLMVRMVDGPFYSVKDVEVEVHDPEESVGGTTVWLTIEEY